MADFPFNIAKGAGFGGGLKFLSKSRQCPGAVGGNKCAACCSAQSF